MRFEGQHRGCCDGCAWAARAVATLYRLRAPIAPFAHWPASRKAWGGGEFLNASTRKTARAGQFLSGGRSGRRRAACWRPLRHNSNLKWAASAGQLHAQASEFRPRAACLMLLMRPVTPSEHCGAFGRRVAGAPILSQSTRWPPRTNSAGCTDYEHPTSSPLR